MLLFALSPIIGCAIAILVFRKSSHTSALIGIIITAILIALNSNFTINISGFQTVAIATFILSLSAALVIIPGLYLNEVLSAQGIIDNLALRVASLPLQKEEKALLLLLGILPAVEALTGFGVSLFLGIPIFFRLFAPPHAYRLSLLGMNIMPWGTLSLATLVGASLSGNSVSALGTMTALTSALIFPTIGVIAVMVMGNFKQHGAIALLLGVTLSISLYGFNRIGLTEVSGIMAGLTTAFLGFLLLVMRGKLVPSQQSLETEEERGNLSLVHVLFPYGLVLSLLAITRGIAPLYNWLSNQLVLSSGEVNLRILSSPGVTLAASILLLLAFHPVSLNHHKIWQRVGTALLALSGFILLSQLMNEAKLITAIATTLQGWENQELVVLLTSPLFGMFSGFITGSNVGGNALLMTVQTQIGEMSDHQLLFSALQNSAAGHAVFTSLPIIVLVKTIALDQVKGINRKQETIEQELLTFGFKVAPLIYITLIFTLIILQNMPFSTIGFFYFQIY